MSEARTRYQKGETRVRSSPVFFTACALQPFGRLPVSIFQFPISIFQFRISVLPLLAGLNLIHDLLRTGLRQMEKARAMRNLFKCGNEHLGVGQGFFLEFSLDL